MIRQEEGGNGEQKIEEIRYLQRYAEGCSLSRQLEAILTVDNISEFNLYVLRNLGDHLSYLSG